MRESTKKTVQFPSFNSHRIEAQFSGGAVSSDGGTLLLRSADRSLGLIRKISSTIKDERQAWKVRHSVLSMLRQRVYGIALGYEDLNDHDELRHDIGLQACVDRVTELGSSSTLCRLENGATREMCVAMHGVLMEVFLDSFKREPREVVLDFDATDDPVHGRQEGRFFHGYYDCYCFLPLYVFCGEQLLAAYLRASNIDAARHAGAILRLIVAKIRERFPNVRIVLRGDSGFCRYRMLQWCERHGVKYVVGIAKNARLVEKGAALIRKAEKNFEKTKEKQRLFSEFSYAAESWDRKRRVIIKAEHSAQGSNPRFIVTNMNTDAQELYDKVYCARGDMENRIKEQQLGLFSDRTSCHDWWPNQFRVLLSGLAYVLLSHIRRVALKGTELAKAQVHTIRCKLLKIGAVVLRTSWRIRFLLSSAHPYQELFFQAAARLKT